MCVLEVERVDEGDDIEKLMCVLEVERVDEGDDIEK